LTPSAIAGRFIGPKILIVSIPKSGTHMLEGILEKMPTLRNSGWKTVVNKTISKRTIDKITRGMFVNSHIHYSSELMNYIVKSNVKVIFMIRDPRDIVVSRYKYVTEIDYLHPAHGALGGLNDNSERLLASITGIEGKMPSIERTLIGFRGWLNEQHALKIRYEDLVGSIGLGSDSMRYKTIINIAKYLELPIENEKIQRVEETLRHKNTSTRRKGIIGGWKEEFKAQHSDYFTQNLQILMDEYGYGN
jgi:hypothetical protein